MYENLRRIEDLHPLMARAQGLTEQRRDAGTATDRSSTDVSRQSATLEMCLRGLQKAAGDVLAERERNIAREPPPTVPASSTMTRMTDRILSERPPGFSLRKSQELMRNP
jgi:hypothetical protein